MPPENHQTIQKQVLNNPTETQISLMWWIYNSCIKVNVWGASNKKVSNAYQIKLQTSSKQTNSKHDRCHMQSEETQQSDILLGSLLLCYK